MFKIKKILKTNSHYKNIKVSAAIIFLLVFFSVFGCSDQGEINYDNSKWSHLSSRNSDFARPGTSKNQTANIVLDIDKDGINDFVVASREKGSSVKWYRREDDGWKKYLIDKSTLWIEAGGTYYDIDGDGDLDIVFGSDAADNKVWWWENPYPDYHPKTTWKRYIIKNSGAKRHHDQIFGDFDGDGSGELVFWNQKANKLMLADIPQHPKKTEPWPYVVIYSDPSDINSHAGLAKADIDGDGKTDILGGGNWFKHMGGKEYKANIVEPELTKARVAVGQLKKGGPPEIVLVAHNGPTGVRWYEFKDNSWVAHDLVDFILYDTHTLQVGDINGDGNLDILTAEMKYYREELVPKMLIFLGDGKGNFVREQIAEGFSNHDSKLSDLDGDGDLDILIQPVKWRAPVIDILINNNRWQSQVRDTN